MGTIVPFNPAKAGEIAESVLVRGDLAQLTHQERASYYVRICESLGLNPMTKPFEYLLLNGKLTLYALKACTDQLRSIHGVSVTELTEDERDGVYIVTAHMRDRDGRTDAGKGAVSLIWPDRIKDKHGNWINHPKAGQRLTGDDLANALMKAETKAKRRATLSLCGLGFLDETEIETIPESAKVEPKTKTSRPKTIVPAPKERLRQDLLNQRCGDLAEFERRVDGAMPHKPKDGGLADRAMVARAQEAWKRADGPGHTFVATHRGPIPADEYDERNPPPHNDIPDFLDRRTKKAAAALNRELHPMNDDLPEHCR